MRGWAWGLIVVSGWAGAANGAPTVGQVDDFQDGTTRGWTNGGSATDPSNVASGGPGGAGDRYLQIVSTGIGGPGSKLVSFNRGQWTGAYPSNIAAIEMDLRNFGSGTLMMRIALNASGAQFASTNPFLLSNDGQWHHARFNLTDADMTDLLFNDTAPISSVLAGVTEMRIVHSTSPAFVPPNTVAATVGVDNITAIGVPEPGAFAAAIAGVGLTGLRRRRRA